MPCPPSGSRTGPPWLAWPHNVRDWPGRFGPIPWVYADVVKKLAEGETVRLLVGDAAEARRARGHLARAGADLARVEWRRLPTDRVWTRDAGPIVLRRRGGGRAVAGFRFNAWAKYPDWRRDARIPGYAARSLGLPLLPVRHGGREVVLEGGAIDVNGRGTVLATEECLLDPTVTQYKEMPLNDFQCYISAVYHLLLATIRSSDRSLMLKYIDDIAIRRFAEGFEPPILCRTLKLLSDVIINHLGAYKEMAKIKQEVYDNIGLSLQLAQDEIEDLYDSLVRKMPGEILARSANLPDCKELQKMIHQLSAFYQVAPEDFNLSPQALQDLR